jgi:hypothetical protein
VINNVAKLRKSWNINRNAWTETSDGFRPRIFIRVGTRCCYFATATRRSLIRAFLPVSLRR